MIGFKDAFRPNKILTQEWHWGSSHNLTNFFLIYNHFLGGWHISGFPIATESGLITQNEDCMLMCNFLHRQARLIITHASPWPWTSTIFIMPALQLPTPLGPYFLSHMNLIVHLNYNFISILILSFILTLFLCFKE